MSVSRAALAAAAVLLLAVGLVQAQQGEAKVDTGAGVATAANAKIDSASVNPAAPSLNNAADLSATARNTGNTAGNLTLRITLTPPGGGTPFVLTNTTASKAAGASLVLAQVGCANCTSALGTWTVLVEALVNGTVADTKQFTYAVASSSASSGAGTSGGGGAPTPSPVSAIGPVPAPAFRDVRFLIQPVLIELRPGDAREADFQVANGLAQSRTLRIETLLPEQWVYFPQKVIGLPGDEKAFLKGVLSPPPDAVPGDYRVAVKLLDGGQVVAETFVILRVKAPAPGLSGPSALRVLEVDAAKNVTRVNLVIRNGERPVPKLEVEEQIPKNLAARVTDISFTNPPDEVLQADPVVKWVLFDLSVNETRSLAYTLPGVRSDWSSYIYFPVKQVTASFEAAPPAFKVEAFSEPMTPGASGSLRVTITSLLKTPQHVTGRLDGPSSWGVEPKEFAVDLPALDRKQVVFDLAPPGDAQAGTQSLVLTLSSEGSHQVVSFDVVVRAAGWDWWLLLFFAAVVAAAAVGVRAVVVRQSRRVLDRLLRLEALRRAK